MTRTQWAPVAVFAYKRPQHLEATLKSLKHCEGFAQSRIHIFFDGPRTANERKHVEETRAVGITLVPQATVHKSDVNKGLANSVAAGVALLCKEYGRVIVVEDDLILSPQFLTYLNAALDHYQDEPKVMHVSGYMYPTATEWQAPIFLPTIASWGWGTWERAWRNYDPSAAGWQEVFTNRSLRREFDLDGAADFSTMLQEQMKGRIDSWVIRWYWTVFKAKGLVLYPPRTLVLNKGFDATGTHGATLTARVLGKDALTPLSLDMLKFPECVELSIAPLTEVKSVLYRIFGGRLRRLARGMLHAYRHARRSAKR